MTQAAKKQRAVIGRRLPDGSVQLLGEVDAPFVSSRLGADVSCETNEEQVDERELIAAAIADLEDEDAA